MAVSKAQSKAKAQTDRPVKKVQAKSKAKAKAKAGLTHKTLQENAEFSSMTLDQKVKTLTQKAKELGKEGNEIPTYVGSFLTKLEKSKVWGQANTESKRNEELRAELAEAPGKIEKGRAGLLWYINKSSGAVFNTLKMSARALIHYSTTKTKTKTNVHQVVTSQQKQI